MNKHRRRMALALVLLLLLGGGAWLWFRPRPKPDDPQPDRPDIARDYLLVPADLAGYYRLDGPEAILAHCRDKVRAANYVGIFRGAHGTLWANEGNEWDRALLAVEALIGAGVEARIVPGSPPRVAYRQGQWKTVRLHGTSAPEVSEEVPAGAVSPDKLTASHFHLVEPELFLERKDGSTKQIKASAPERLADWVHQPVILGAYPGAGGPRYEFRVGDRVVFTTEGLDQVRRAVLTLTWRHGEKQSTWRRELFDERNGPDTSPGPARPRAGDRHAIVLAAGAYDPVAPPVPPRDKAPAILQARAGMMGPADKVARDLVLTGTRYFHESDDQTRKLARQTEVTVAWEAPRWVIASMEPDLSLDVQSDRVEARGPRSREFHVGRGLATDVIEARLLFERTGLPAVTASTVFSHHRSPSPDSPERRLARLRPELERLLADEPAGTVLVLTARGEREGPSLRIERTPKGLVLHGARENRAVAKGRLIDRYSWDTASKVELGNRVELAALIADGLLGDQMRRPDFHLVMKVSRAWPTAPVPIGPGAILTYRGLHDGNKFRLHALATLKDGLPHIASVYFPGDSGWRSDLTFRQQALFWPDLVTLTPEGVSLEGLLAPAGVEAAGEAVTMSLNLGGRRTTVHARKVPLPSAPTWVEVNEGGRWRPALFALKNGMVQRVGEGTEASYRIQKVGAGAGGATQAPRSQLRPLRAVEVKVGESWKLGNLLETEGDVFVVHPSGEPAAGVVRVAGDRVRPVTLVEAQVGGKWQLAHLAGRKGDERLVRAIGTEGDAVVLKPAQVRHAELPPDKDAFAAVLPTGGQPLLLSWRRGRTAIVLDEVSPALRGRLTDEKTGLPVAGARVTQKGTRLATRSAADGTFVLPLADLLAPQFIQINRRFGPQFNHPAVRPAQKRPVFVLVDASAAMSRSAAPGDEKEASAGRRRWDALRRSLANWLKESFARVDSNNFELWSFAAPDDHKGTFAEYDLVKKVLDSRYDQPVTEELGKLRPAGKAPLTAVVARLAELGRTGKLPADATVLLWASGENACTLKSAADAYRQSGLVVPLHVFGVGTKAGTAADRALSDLAEASGGTYRRTSDKPPHEVHRHPYQVASGGVQVEVDSPCHGQRLLSVPYAQADGRELKIPLAGECCCQSKKSDLITITKANVADLARCEGLSAKARAMIEERVKDGTWTVTIPTRRVNLGNITAYGWFETELASGRLVGRTEDGLHGASAAGGRWPSYRAAGRAAVAFLVWYHGVVAYTTGSVLAGLSWHRQPEFANADPEQFKRFVQANALQFSANWWSQVGSTALGGAFADYADAYWAGVCLNFTLQSLALKLPADECYRLWLNDFCRRAATHLKDKALDYAGEKRGKLLAKQFGKERGKLLDALAKHGLGPLRKKFDDWWDDTVLPEINCADWFLGSGSGGIMVVGSAR